MIKKLAILYIFVLSSNFIISQNDMIKSLVDKTDSLDLDMWDLVDFAKQNLESKNDQARFFYQWIGSNIVYDDELLSNLDKGLVSDTAFWESQDYYRVYENRKGVCAGYAGLYKWFMFEIDIEVAIISGHIRDERNHYLELDADDSFRHAWNAIKLDGKWILLDSTWGTSGNQGVSDFYFDIDPGLAIITHFPEESKWQLLKEPLTLEEFNRSKFIKPYWFQIGFKDIPVLKEDANYYYLVYKSNPNKNWSINLMYGTDNRNYQFINDTVQIEQDDFTYVRFNKSNIPPKAYYKMDLIYKDQDNGTSTSIFNVFYFKT